MHPFELPAYLKWCLRCLLAAIHTRREGSTAQEVWRHTGVCVVGNGGGEADAGGAAAGGAHGEGRQRHHSAQQLALGHARVPHQQAVDVPAQMRPIRQIALPAQTHTRSAGCWCARLC